MRHVFTLLLATLLALAAPVAANAACQYSSVQVRVQPNTSTPWTQSLTTLLGNSVHVGVLKNGWGVPVDPGTITLYAVQGSYSTPVSLTNGWEMWWTPTTQGSWSFHAYCGGIFMGSASASYYPIDVLSYVKPGGATGSIATIVTNKTNPWRTFANAGGSVGERLPGFFITKGNVNYAELPYKAWNFEQMIYDSNWIYLVRDTSWTSKCQDNQREAGMLLFTYENGQWLRGGRHFPRFIANGGTVSTGSKYIQGVEKKLNAGDTGAQEGRWCTANYSGSTYSDVRADVLASYTAGTRTFNDVLRISIVGGSGTGDKWWFAKGVGLIRFGDGTQAERYDSINPDYQLGVRIPCEPNAPCM